MTPETWSVQRQQKVANGPLLFHLHRTRSLTAGESIAWLLGLPIFLQSYRIDRIDAIANVPNE